jgi:ABC-type uncharacterized transport system ATPase subunit
MMKSKAALLCTATLGLLALSGCQSVQQGFKALNGNDAAAQPTTSRVAPLVVPPDYALEPNEVVAVRGQDGAGQEQVLDALFGGSAPRSNSERTVVASAGAAEAGIRSTVGDPKTVTVNKGSVTRDIVAAPEGDGQNAQAAIPQN